MRLPHALVEFDVRTLQLEHIRECSSSKTSTSCLRCTKGYFYIHHLHSDLKDLQRYSRNTMTDHHYAQLCSILLPMLTYVYIAFQSWKYVQMSHVVFFVTVTTTPCAIVLLVLLITKQTVQVSVIG